MQKTISIDWSNFEFDVFGKVADFSEGHPPYIQFKPALEIVRANQPEEWNPRQPHTHIGKRILTRMQFSLGKGFRKHVQIYCALGSQLDFWHGVDGVIEAAKLCGKTNVLISDFVTFDLTYRISLKKMNQKKADFILTKEMLEQNLLNTCDQMAERLKQRILNKISLHRKSYRQQKVDNLTVETNLQNSIEATY